MRLILLKTIASHSFINPLRVVLGDDMRAVKYIKVHFQPYITQDFIDLFNEKTNGKWISQWFKCPAKKCQNYSILSGGKKTFQG